MQILTLSASKGQFRDETGLGKLPNFSFEPEVGRECLEFGAGAVIKKYLLELQLCGEDSISPRFKFGAGVVIDKTPTQTSTQEQVIQSPLDLSSAPELSLKKCLPELQLREKDLKLFHGKSFCLWATAIWLY